MAGEKTYTQAEVERLTKEWQGRLTREQQARAQAERMAENVTGRLDSIESRLNDAIPTQQRGDSKFWESFEGGTDMQREITNLVQQELSSMPRNPELDRLEGMTSHYWSREVDRELSEVAEAWGLDDSQQRQVLEAADRSGNWDLEYQAFKTFGTPNVKPAPQPSGESGGAGEEGEEGEGKAPRRTPAVLSGAANTANPGEQFVDVPRGMKGWAATEAIAKDWAERHGK